MTDNEAFWEAESSVDFLSRECGKRKIPLTIRLNPMYAAVGTKWAERAQKTSKYQPPRLTDVMRLADKKAHEGMVIYIGLSNEGLNEKWGSYLSREDYSNALIKPIKLFNSGNRDAMKGALV